jgi:hypothetical protein
VGGRLSVAADQPPGSGITRPGLARPTAVYAAGGTGGEGQRPRQTVTPLAARFGIPVNTHYAEGDEATLICWQHGELPSILTALGTVTPAPPSTWPDNRFDLVWVMAPHRMAGRCTRSPSYCWMATATSRSPDHNSVRRATALGWSP